MVRQDAVKDTLRVLRRGQLRRGLSEHRIEVAARSYYLLGYSAGVAIARGRPVEPLFEALAEFLEENGHPRSVVLDAGSCADALLHSVPLARGVPKDRQPELWDKVSDEVAELLLRLKQGMRLS